MRVELLVHCFPPDSVGGTELYALRLAQGIAAAGHAVRVLTYMPGKTRQVVSHDAAFEGLAVRRLSFALDKARNPVRDEYDNERVAALFRRAWERERPDVVHAAHFGYLSTSPLAVAAEMGIPTAVTLTDLWPLCPAGMLLRSDESLCPGPEEIGECVRCLTRMGRRGRPYARAARSVPNWAWGMVARMARWPLAQRPRPMLWLDALQRRPQIIRERLLTARAILCPGRFTIAQLVRNGYPAEALAWAPHGIPEPQSLRRTTPTATSSAVRFGYIGPLARHKGAHLLMEAFTSLAAQTRGVLAFWGPLPDDADAYGQAVLQRIAETPGVVHRGPFVRESLAAVLDGIDVLIAPSLCYENTPTIIYEALAHGTPVLGSDQGGIEELVRIYKGGWLYARGDIRALAERLRWLNDDPERVRQAADAILVVPSFADHVGQVLHRYGT